MLYIILLESDTWGKLTSFGVDNVFSNSWKSKKCGKLTSFGVDMFFPTCQVRVVRFYVSCLLLSSSPPPPPPAQPRPSTHSVLCRTSTTTIHAQCSLPDLNHGHPRPVFPAGPQPRPSTPSVPCRTSTASIHAKCSLPDLM